MYSLRSFLCLKSEFIQEYMVLSEQCESSWTFLCLYRIRIMTAMNVTIAYIISFFAVVVFRVVDYMAPILRRLGRSTTLTGRTYIWDRTINAIKNKPIFGYGMQSTEIRVAFVPEAHGATSAHNFILENLYLGGIIQLIIVVLFIGMIVYELQKYKKEEVTHCLVLGMACTYVIFLVESGFSLSLFALLYLSYYAGRLCQVCRQGPSGYYCNNHRYKNKGKKEINSST